MFILRLPYALMTGVIVGASALIPVMGAYIGAIVGAFLIVTISPLKAVEFVVYLAILQQIEGNVIYPRVVGGSIGLPGIWVLAAVSVGGGLLEYPGHAHRRTAHRDGLQMDPDGREHEAAGRSRGNTGTGK